MTMHTTNGPDGIAASHDIAQRACQSCQVMTEELGAAMDRIEVLIVERDAARARVLELESSCIPMDTHERLAKA